MTKIHEALELLTGQHEQIEDLVEQVRQIGDEGAFVELADKLSAHLALEQEVLYPAMAAEVSREVMTELMAEHTAIKHVLAELIWLGTRDPEFRPLLARLGALVVGHASWQEDELFTTADEKLSRDQLAVLCECIYSFDGVANAA